MDNEAFLKMPKVLFADEYKDLSAEAKLLYGLMLDRMNLSAINGWCDKTERSLFFTPLPKQVKNSVAGTIKLQSCSVSLKSIICFAVNIRAKANLQSCMF